MSKTPHAPPASEEEQFHEVARLLGVALGRWHKLNRGKVADHAAVDECVKSDGISKRSVLLAPEPQPQTRSEQSVRLRHQ